MGHEVAMKLFIEQDDVEADSKDNDAWMPLWWAVSNGHEAVVKLLGSHIKDQH